MRGTVWDGINSCSQKSNSWQFSSSGLPPPPKLQITRGIPLTSAPASSPAKSPDSPHNTVLTPECSHVSIDFPAKSLGHYDLELNDTLCTCFSHLNQQIIACVWEFPPAEGEHKQLLLVIKYRGAASKEMAQEMGRQGKRNLFTVNEHRICKTCPGFF